MPSFVRRSVRTCHFFINSVSWKISNRSLFFGTRCESIQVIRDRSVHRVACWLKFQRSVCSSGPALLLPSFRSLNARSGKAVRRASLIAAVICPVAASIGVGCGNSLETASQATGAPTPGAEPTPSDSSSGSSSPGFSTEDAGSAGADQRGYGLCNVIEGSACSPDDDGVQTPKRASVGRCGGGTANVTADAGSAGSDEPDAALQARAPDGCRLTVSSNIVVPQCLPANPDGLDGASCTSGSDCAPGFDCVVGTKGSVCRRYCCSGTCEGVPTQNGGASFCDVHRLVDTWRKAPVCMPVKRCTLLDPKSCSDDETCALTETGAAACVGIGPVLAGDSCESDHCAAGLTCLGAPGSRKCYRICRVDEKSCGGNQTCKTSALFKDPSFGVCGGP